MLHAETVVPFPTDRTAIRRLAQAHADANAPMHTKLFENVSDQIAYENAYIDRARQTAGEIAECA